MYVGSVENAHGFRPVRRPESKWHLSRELLPDSYVPWGVQYAAGWAYLLSRDAAVHALAVRQKWEADPDDAPLWYKVVHWGEWTRFRLAQGLSPLGLSWKVEPAMQCQPHLRKGPLGLSQLVVLERFGMTQRSSRRVVQWESGPVVKWESGALSVIVPVAPMSELHVEAGARIVGTQRAVRGNRGRIAAAEDVQVGLMLSSYLPGPYHHPGFKRPWDSCPPSTVARHLDVDAPALMAGLYEQEKSGLWDVVGVQCSSGEDGKEG